MKDKIKVNTFDELNDLIKNNISHFELNFKFLSKSENQKYTTSLVSHINTCGCYQGRVGVVISGMILVICYLFFKNYLPFDLLWLNILVFLFGGAFIGKLLGKLYSVVILQRTIFILKNKFKIEAIGL